VKERERRQSTDHASSKKRRTTQPDEQPAERVAPSLEVETLPSTSSNARQSPPIQATQVTQVTLPDDLQQTKKREETAKKREVMTLLLGGEFSAAWMRAQELLAQPINVELQVGWKLAELKQAIATDRAKVISSLTDSGRLVAMGRELAELARHVPATSPLSAKVKKAWAMVFNGTVPLDLEGVDVELVEKFFKAFEE